MSVKDYRGILVEETPLSRHKYHWDNQGDPWYPHRDNVTSENLKEWAYNAALEISSRNDLSKKEKAFMVELQTNYVGLPPRRFNEWWSGSGKQERKNV